MVQAYLQPSNGGERSQDSVFDSTWHYSWAREHEPAVPSLFVYSAVDRTTRQEAIDYENTPGPDAKPAPLAMNPAAPPWRPGLSSRPPGHRFDLKTASRAVRTRAVRDVRARIDRTERYVRGVQTRGDGGGLRRGRGADA